MQLINKTQSQRIHAKKRAKSRYNLVFNTKQLNDLVQLIQTGKGQFIKKQSNRISHFKLFYENQELVVVYDKLRKNIVTFLPKLEVNEILP